MGDSAGEPTTNRREGEHVQDLLPVRPIDLAEKISPTLRQFTMPRQFTTISILKPVIRIERGSERDMEEAVNRNGGEAANRNDIYRISTSFNLEVEILGFSQESVLVSIFSEEAS